LAQVIGVDAKGFFGSVIHTTIPLAIVWTRILWWAIPREVATVGALPWAIQFASIAPLGFVNTLAALMAEMFERPFVALTNTNHFGFATSSHF
jgi:hypothetical protein